MPAADVLLLNGHLLTMAGRRASALAVVGDRIVAVGADEEIACLRGPRTRVLDLQGRLALPGFTDSHIHLMALARRLSQVDLGGAESLAQALRRVAARARRVPAGQWITGGRFDKNRWGLGDAGGFPTRHDLDRVSHGRPVALHSRDGHSVWLNSLALKLCGITRSTRTPAGGVIVRDARGEPTGILQERASGLLWQCQSFGQSEVAAGDLKGALRFLLRQGITSAHVMEEAETLSAVQALRERGELPVRLTIYRSRDRLDDLIAAGIRSGFGDELSGAMASGPAAQGAAQWIRMGGIKLLVDGSLGSQTAWMFRPYRALGGAGPRPALSCGVPVLHGRELREIVARAHRAGLACAIHAIGDRANAEALDTFERVAGLRGGAQLVPETAGWKPALPDRIEHAQLLRRRDIPRFAQLGVIASMQPCHLLGDIPVADRHWGRRSRWAYPIASLLRAGVTVAFGSDAPVETSDPVAGIFAAVQRQMLNGEPRGGWYRKEEGIGVRAALRGYTVGPALASGEAAFKGKLLPGYLADIVVLSEDITRLRGRAMLGVRPDLAVVGGRLKYRRHAI